TMELGGHAPGIVFEDADVDQAVKVLAGGKFRNAGQVCIAPTRLLVQEPLYDKFVDKFTAAAKAIKVGDGLDPSTKMGPLVSSRRRRSRDRDDRHQQRRARLARGAVRRGQGFRLWFRGRRRSDRSLPGDEVHLAGGSVTRPVVPEAASGYSEPMTTAILRGGG